MKTLTLILLSCAILFIIISTFIIIFIMFKIFMVNGEAIVFPVKSTT